ncbi:hypothetical protein MLD38_031949 [Melastoma candidum]|uniref:Uncharacterized protein n=1 Tax=Melastoma candidum TaxID=119954 RepID=A0ACB9MVV3_9MYRT|nr:hypothetical protein MLD38_031949 [Melastoma candidum]
MGHKKRTPRPPPKQPVDANPQRRSAAEPDVDDDYGRAKTECERAITTFRRGNHTKALRLIKESCAKFEGSLAASALLYRVQGAISRKISKSINDTNDRYFYQAMDSGRRAVELSLLSVEFPLFYANLLFDIADDEKEYKEVIAECERALKIKCPVDPYKESLQDESQWKNGTGSERIGQVRDDLKALIQRSNIEIISIWMTELEGAIKGEKFKLIPVGWTPKDPFEVQPVQKVQRPDEIKKVVKTLEERRKEIEARVTAARLLQQKMELPSAGDEANKSLDPLSGSASGDKAGERRKVVVLMPPPSMERMDLVRNYWNSICEDVKEGTFRVTIPELNRHYAKEKDGSSLECLQEAFDHARSSKGWRFWGCCRCNKKFGDSESLIQHVFQDHRGNLPPKMQSVLPQEVDSEWTEKIICFDWKPRDVTLATDMTGSMQPKCQAGDNGNDDSHDCFEDASDASPDEEKGSKIGCGGSDDVENNNSIRVHGHVTNSFDDNKWPLSDDPGCLRALETIRGLLEVLIRNKCLSTGHLTKVLQFAVEALQEFDSGSLVLQNSVDQLLAYICFLGEYELRKVLKFLQGLCQNAGLSECHEKSSESFEEAGFVSQDMELKERVVLDGDVISIAIDSQGKSSSTAESYASGDVAASVPMDIDSLLSWMYAVPSLKDPLTQSLQRKDHAMEILQRIEKEFCVLQSMCEKKIELLGFAEALHSAEDLCINEGKRRGGNEDPRSFHSVLRKRLEELQVDKTDAILDSGKNEVDAITRILREAEALNAAQLDKEDCHGGVASNIHDRESGDVEDSKSTRYLHQEDTCIEVTIEKQKDECSDEINKIDARIMKSVANRQQLEHNLEALSSFDYRVVIVPLVKSYMKIRLEELAEKDAIEKSDAAREALLAELALDSKESIKGGTNNSKQVQGRRKDKKRHKDNRKAKDLKTRGTNENPLINQEIDIAVSLPTASDKDLKDSEVPLPTASDKDLKDSEVPANDEEEKELEEMRWKTKLAAMERKLEEYLQYQRQIEDEAKQRQLAKQGEQVAGTLLKKTDEDLLNVNLETQAKNEEKQKQPTSPIQSREEDCPLHIGEVEGAISFPDITAPSAITQENRVMEKSEGLSEGVSPEQGWVTHWGPRRRARLRKHSSKSSVRNDEISVEGTVEPKGVAVESPSSYRGDLHAKTIRQSLAEEDDDGRFQADIEQEVHESLAVTKLGNAQSTVDEKDLTHGETAGAPDVTDVIGTGLQNEAGEYNCFLNVIIQSLWHIRQFRDKFLNRSPLDHAHVGDPCVVCALHEIFTALGLSAADVQREPVSPTSMRIALSNLYPDSNFFQEGQMNDASEVLGVIFDCLHKSFTRNSGAPNDESADGDSKGSWDCKDCLVHSLFGMDILERMNCRNCGLESRHLMYTSFFHNINASALRMMKMMSTQSPLEELLDLVEMIHRLPCDSDAGGCGKLNCINHFLSAPPHVFTTVLGWKNASEDAADISATLATLSPDIDIGVLFCGIAQKQRHRLVSVVCYCWKHYYCFAYSHDQGRWIMYDDRIVKAIGSWEDVLASCEKSRVQPQVLFFEAVAE